MKFEIVSPNSADDVISAYQHIDNGGHTISVTKDSDITIQTGFFGYSMTSVLLTGVNLDSLIGVLQEAKKRIEQEQLVDRLKGNI